MTHNENHPIYLNLNMTGIEIAKPANDNCEFQVFADSIKDEFERLRRSFKNYAIIGLASFYLFLVLLFN